MTNAAKEDTPDQSYVSENNPPVLSWTGMKWLTWCKGTDVR